MRDVSYESLEKKYSKKKSSLILGVYCIINVLYNVTLLSIHIESFVNKSGSSGYCDPGKHRIITKYCKPKAHSVHIIRLNIECLT